MPEFICDPEFDFQPNEYQEYIDGVNEGYYDGCTSLAYDIYESSYDEGHEKGLAAYNESIVRDEVTQYSSPKEINSDNSSWSGLIYTIGTLAAFYGFFFIVGSWKSIKNWWKNE